MKREGYAKGIPKTPGLKPVVYHVMVFHSETSPKPRPYCNGTYNAGEIEEAIPQGWHRCPRCESRAFREKKLGLIS
jgi:hypothetical protein